MNTATLTASVPMRQDAAIVGLVGLAHAASHFSHLLLPLMFPVFVNEFGLRYSELGLLMTVYFAISGLGQAGAGFLVDRKGARPVLFASMALLLLACLLAAAADGYALLVLVAATAGLANASFHPVDFTIMNQRVSPQRLGHAFSVHGLTGNLGWALAPVFFAAATRLSDWRGAYLCAAAMYGAILLLLLAHRDKLSTQSAQPKAGRQPAHDLAFMRLPVLWWCFGFFLLSTMTLAMVQSFAIPLLKALHGVPFETASMTLSAYSLCAAAGMLAGGFVTARTLHSDKVVASCMAAAAGCLLLCASAVLDATGTMAVLATTGFAIGIGGPSRDMMIKRATPAGATGRVYGMVYSGLDVGFAIAPVAFGMLMDRGLYSLTFFAAAMLMLLSALVALGVGRRIGPPAPG